MAEEKTEDPFTRRKCQPTLVTLVCPFLHDVFRAVHTIMIIIRGFTCMHAFFNSQTREAAPAGTAELLHQLAEAQTTEEKEAVQASLVGHAIQCVWFAWDLGIHCRKRLSLSC